MKIIIHFIRFLGFILLLIISNKKVFSQAPESMNYQAVIRNSSGNLVTNQLVNIKINILKGGINGVSVYEEVFSPITNNFGSISLQIGNGTVLNGLFSNITWGSDSYFVETSADILGGNNFNVISTTQFLSVPYALYSKVSDSIRGHINNDFEFPIGSILISENPNDTTLINNNFMLLSSSVQNHTTFSQSNNTVNDTLQTIDWETVFQYNITENYLMSNFGGGGGKSAFYFQDKIYLIFNKSGTIIKFDLVNNTAEYSASSTGWSNDLYYETSIWTGNDFFIFRSGDGQVFNNELWKYNPTSNIWSQINLDVNHIPRMYPEMHWTGAELLFSGGFTNHDNPYQNFLIKYNPVTNIWSNLSNINSPSPRYGHVSILENNKLYVWGGIAGIGDIDTYNNGMNLGHYIFETNGVTVYNNGFIYDLNTNNWTSMSSGPLSSRHLPVHCWIENKILIYGGVLSTGSPDGALYDPQIDSWTMISGISDINFTSYGNNSVFDGNKLILVDNQRLISEYYNFQDDSWSSISGQVPKLNNYIFNSDLLIKIDSNLSYAIDISGCGENGCTTVLLKKCIEREFPGISSSSSNYFKTLYYYVKQ